MNRPAIDPANIRRQQTGYKIRRWWVEHIIAVAIALPLLWFIASIDSLIP